MLKSSLNSYTVRDSQVMYTYYILHLPSPRPCLLPVNTPSGYGPRDVIDGGTLERSGWTSVNGRLPKETCFLFSLLPSRETQVVGLW